MPKIIIINDSQYFHKLFIITMNVSWSGEDWSFRLANGVEGWTYLFDEMMGCASYVVETSAYETTLDVAKMNAKVEATIVAEMFQGGI